VSKEISLYKPILQRMATSRNKCRRIVALEKGAGSSPVGHLSTFDKYLPFRTSGASRTEPSIVVPDEYGRKQGLGRLALTIGSKPMKDRPEGAEDLTIPIGYHVTGSRFTGLTVACVP
jgi:hypothetical protein